MRWLVYHKDFSLQGEGTEASLRTLWRIISPWHLRMGAQLLNESKENGRVTRLVLAAMVSFRLDPLCAIAVSFSLPLE
jgi:hypothetical protein